MNAEIRSIVEGWLDRHEYRNPDGPADGPRTIMVLPEDAEELETAVAADGERVREAAQALVDKLRLCQPYIDSATTIAAIHGCPYPKDPNYGVEFAALVEVLRPVCREEGR